MNQIKKKLLAAQKAATDAEAMARKAEESTLAARCLGVVGQVNYALEAVEEIEERAQG